MGRAAGAFVTVGAFELSDAALALFSSTHCSRAAGDDPQPPLA
jgi:hypothetical protein